MIDLRGGGVMKRDGRWTWLPVVGALVICLPCLVLPVAALGAGAALAAVGGFLTGQFWLLAVGLLLAVALGVALWVCRRRQAAACCALSPTDPLEIQR